jgi:hypothetical protein
MGISWAERVGNEEVLQTVKEERNILHTANGKKTGLATYCLGTAYWNTLLKENELQYEEEDVSSYWMTLSKYKGTQNWDRKS